MGNDRFEEFARKNTASTKETFEVPQPIEYQKRSCTLRDSMQPAILTEPKLSTASELAENLKEMRQQYEPFLKDFAPALENMRIRIPITQFTQENGELISIPFYNAPVGNAKKEYVTAFTLGDYAGKSVFVCFKGADYLATVYINGECVGMHEGFFAPFEFEITSQVRPGENTLKVVLENDFCYMGNGVSGEVGGEYRQDMIEGDKLYAATGPGYDDPIAGWHHCPPGMGLIDAVSVEIRDICHVSDLFVQPHLEEGSATVWVEVQNTSYQKLPIHFRLSLYGQNFEGCVFEKQQEVPTYLGEPLPAKHGKNVYKFTFAIPEARVWDPQHPYLYQLQVEVINADRVCDTEKCQFGMRSFVQDTENVPKGKLYLNGQEIRLRGANTMGFEQQDVLRGDEEQLIKDILLAKICNMNYWRLTQRPVQEQVYTYCDKLGLMTQTDLPLFGVMRRTKMCEGARQAEEMIRLVRKHPCNILVTYINERWENANFEPHRHMLHEEMEVFFEICDRIVKYNHPDAVIKHVEGDFDPPSRTTLPDYHCYTLWYNGAQIDFGQLHRGFAQPVNPQWCYGCGEYGAEGLDFPEVMRSEYPKEWLEEPFDPGKIISAQSKLLHGSFMDTPKSMEEWSLKTQAHQAFATRMMTESFRRDPRMVSTAIHLFIDAWPAGWMKAIMDCKRNPKPAYFACRNALEPILVSLRSDRFTYYEKEVISVETYICNDTSTQAAQGWKIHYELYRGDKLYRQGKTEVAFNACGVTYVSNAECVIEVVKDREPFTLKAILMDDNNHVVSYNTFAFEVFQGTADIAVQKTANTNTMLPETVLITELANGCHEIAGESVTVENCPHDAVYYVSCATGHPLVAEFRERDFNMWYNRKLDRLSPIANQCFRAKGFSPILTCNGSIDSWIVAGEKIYQGKRYVILLADMRHENPVAGRFLNRMHSLYNI